MVIWKKGKCTIHVCIKFENESCKNIHITFFCFCSQKYKKCIYEFIRDLISRMIGIIVSHPLDVIALRMMAQFVGGETKYKYLNITIRNVKYRYMYKIYIDTIYKM